MSDEEWLVQVNVIAPCASLGSDNNELLYFGLVQMLYCLVQYQMCQLYSKSRQVLYFIIWAVGLVSISVSDRNLIWYDIVSVSDRNLLLGYNLKGLVAISDGIVATGVHIYWLYI